MPTTSSRRPRKSKPRVSRGTRKSAKPKPRDAIERTVRDVFADGVFLCVRLGADAPLVEACRAAVRGGLTVLEITLTTPGALKAIETMAKEKGVIAGAGTVLTRKDARAVARAGGRFALSPVFDPDVVDEAHRLGLLAVPGTSTPTEILAAHRHGARMVKVFPAAALGGPAYLRAVRGHFARHPAGADQRHHRGNDRGLCGGGSGGDRCGWRRLPVGFHTGSRGRSRASNPHGDGRGPSLTVRAGDHVRAVHTRVASRRGPRRQPRGVAR